MKYIVLPFILIVFLTSCSQHVVKKEVIVTKPPIKKIIPIKKITSPTVVQGLIPETIIQKAEKKYGLFARKRYEAYNAKFSKLQNSSTKVKLEVINKFFNQVSYVLDKKIWNKSDYWATPLEFLGKDKGDCEDYVIAKYFSLLDLGVEKEKLCFSYVKSIPLDQSHMVLSYFETPYSVPLILDNINYNIFPADKRMDLIPLYNFNGKTLHRAGIKGKNGPKVKSSKLLKTWDMLIADIRKNKL
ncbi:MAG: putative transglutaminase-like cysteine proteinase [Sulfurimonas sp.]|uniref:transglutaminase-like cysteine peptidase n=1 Tax=Sulfurimonas sp. TaxID=2022749 RepID=UPI0039E4534C